MPTKQPLDHLRSKKKPVRKTVLIASDSELAARLTEMEEDLRRRENSPRVREGRAPESEISSLEALREEMKTVKAKVEKEAIKFVFQSLPRKQYEDLVLEHPANDTQVKEAEKEGVQGLQWDPETFPYALIDACCIEPAHDPGDLSTELQTDRWNQAEVQELFQAAMFVHVSRQIVTLGKE